MFSVPTTVRRVAAVLGVLLVVAVGVTGCGGGGSGSGSSSGGISGSAS
ncbi:hypothetical protein [Thiohalobacter sp.]|nr:hypothetical protein [Thiohalobacter sp.]